MAPDLVKIASKIAVKTTRKVLFVALVALLVACDKSADLPQSQGNFPTPQLIQDSLDELSRAAQQQDDISANLILKLKTATSQFLTAPGQETLSTLQSAWQESHEAYLVNQLGLYIDAQAKYKIGFNLDAWPLQPGFLDSISGYPYSGIVNDITLEITSQTLRSQHGITAIDEVSLGYHAIEYLIFARPLEDFVLTADAASQLAIQRRREMLRLLITELSTEMQTLSSAIHSQEETSSTPHERLYQWTISVRQYLQLAFRESNFLLDNSLGHNAFSNTSRESLLVVLGALKAATGNHLMAIFVLLDEAAAKNYVTTLNLAIDLLNNVEADESAQANLPLMLSALLHQLETFELKLIPPNN